MCVCVCVATEEIALRSGSTIGALLNATFGNAVELILGIIALKEGLIRVVQGKVTRMGVSVDVPINDLTLCLHNSLCIGIHLVQSFTGKINTFLSFLHARFR